MFDLLTNRSQDAVLEIDRQLVCGVAHQALQKSRLTGPDHLLLGNRRVDEGLLETMGIDLVEKAEGIQISKFTKLR